MTQGGQKGCNKNTYVLYIRAEEGQIIIAAQMKQQEDEKEAGMRTERNKIRTQREKYAKKQENRTEGSNSSIGSPRTYLLMATVNVTSCERCGVVSKSRNQMST